MNFGTRRLLTLCTLVLLLLFGVIRMIPQERAASFLNPERSGLGRLTKYAGVGAQPAWLSSTSPPRASANLSDQADTFPADIPDQLHADSRPSHARAAAATATPPCGDKFSATADAPITIGAILPLSSPGALDSGFVMQFALNTATKVANLHGGVNGRPVRLVTYDSAGIPRRGAMYAERLIDLDCATVIVGLFHNNVATTVIDVAQARGVPVILVGADDPLLTAGRSPVTFRIVPTAPMRDRNLVNFLADTLASDPARYLSDELATVFYVTEGSEDARREAARLLAYMGAAGISGEHLTIDLPTHDYSATVARIVASDVLADAVVINLPPEPALDFHAQLLAAGVGPVTNTLIVTGDESLTSDFWTAIPDGVETVAAWDGPWNSTVNKVGRYLAADFQQYFGRWPEPIAFSAYDSLLLAVDALKRATAPQGVDLVTALEQSDVELAGGHYSFAYGRHADPAAAGVADEYWHQWLDPQLLYLQYSIPAQPPAAADVIWPPALRTPRLEKSGT